MPQYLPPSQQRINPRRARRIARKRVVPSYPRRAPFTAQEVPVPQFDSLAAAREEAALEYEKKGSISPATQAAIDRLENPDMFSSEPQPVVEGSQAFRQAQLTQGKANKLALQQFFPGVTAPAGTDIRNVAKKPFGTADLTAAVERRRDARLRGLGIDPTSDVIALLKQGGRFAGVNENNSPLFRLPSGQTVVAGNINPTAAKAADEEFTREEAAPATEIAQAGERDAGTVEGVEFMEYPQLPAPTRAPQEMTKGTGMQPEQPRAAPIPQLPNFFASLPPDLAAMLAPIHQMAMGGMGDEAKLLAQAERDFLSGETGARETVSEEIGAAMGVLDRKIAFEDTLSSQRRRQEDSVMRRQLANLDMQQNIARVELARSEQIQREQNIQQELQNRRLAAKFGFNFDTSGLQWMQSEVRKGNEALSYLVQRGALATTELANLRYQAIDTYRYNMSVIDINRRGAMAQFSEEFRQDMKDARNAFFADRKERNGMLSKARERYSDKKKEYDFKVSDLYASAVNQMYDRNERIEKMERDDEKWLQDFLQKSQELSLKGKELQISDFTTQMTARSDAINRAREEIRGSRAVTAYETIYRPAWDNFEVAFARNANYAGREEAILSAFSNFIDSSFQSDSGSVFGILSSFGIKSMESFVSDLKSKGNLSEEDLGQIRAIASDIYAKAQERKNAAVSDVMGTIQNTNLQFTNDIFRIRSEDLGIRMSPLSSEVIQIIATLPDSERTKIVTSTIGKKNITGTKELLLRLQEADRIFYEDTGMHLEITSHFRDTETQRKLYEKFLAGEGGLAAPPGTSAHEMGLAVDIAPAQWKIAQPYLEKVGLKQLPSGLRSSDAGHFSLTGT